MTPFTSVASLKLCGRTRTFKHKTVHHSAGTLHYCSYSHKTLPVRLRNNIIMTPLHAQYRLARILLQSLYYLTITSLRSHHTIITITLPPFSHPITASLPSLCQLATNSSAMVFQGPCNNVHHFLKAFFCIHLLQCLSLTNTPSLLFRRNRRLQMID